jgi:protein-disulfide isomerase
MPMKAREGLSWVFAGMSVLSSLIVAGFVVRRELVGASTQTTVKPPQPVDTWATVRASGHRRGAKVAKVTIVEFADFECPYCRAFTRGPLKAIMDRYPDEVEVVFRHWPLPGHRFAYPAARAAECAANEGKFDEFHDLIYSEQDSLGLKPWTAYAKQAGVSDTVAFARCVQSRTPVAVVDADTRAAKELKLDGTPTVIVDGFRYSMPPDTAVLVQAVREALRRRGPTR